MDLVPEEKTASQYLKLERDASVVGKTVKDAHFQQKLVFWLCICGLGL
jgi:hypothetical protein